MPGDHTLDAARARIGSTLRGKYRLDRILGAGGMAAVYVATHRNAKQFAVKMLHPEISVHESLRTRFLREGYLANSVKHPGAVAVLDDDVAEDGSAFLVMELLEGAPVDDLWLRHDRRLPVALALSIGDALLDVLVAAHARGIVHRDLKPANLFLTKDGALKVLDFGIARLHDDTGGGATVSGATLLGTPAFMSPEQALAKSSDVDAQTDLWAVGATLFTLLSGSTVHEGENAPQVLVAAATKQARSLAAIAPDIPKPIVDVVDRAMAFAKGDRWPSAGSMREALQNASVAALGTPIAILPKSALPSGADVTVAASAGGGSGGSGRVSSGTAFGPTVEAPSDAGARMATPRFSTKAGIAKTTGAYGGARAWGKWALSAAAALGVGMAAAIAYRNAHAPQVTYCADGDLVKSVDGPACTRVLASGAEERRGPWDTAAVTAIGGRVTSVRYENFSGRPYPILSQMTSSNPAIVDMVRAEDGTLLEIDTRNERGVLFEREKLSEGGRVLDVTGEDGEPANPVDPDVARIRREFDSRGFVSRETYFGPTGKPRADAGGAYGHELVRDAAGRETRMIVLGFDGKPGVDPEGRAAVEFVYDEAAKTMTLRRFGLDGRPTSVLAASTEKVAYGADDELLEESYFGMNGAPVFALGAGDGYHAERYRWNPEKRSLEKTLLDEKGRPTASDKNTWSSARDAYDERGRAVLHEHFDTNGNRVRDRHEGTTAIRYLWNERDDFLGVEMLDASGALMQGAERFAKQTYVPDALGRHVEVRSFDESGHPVAPREGTAIMRMTYDGRNLPTSTSYFDANDHPTPSPHGVAVERTKYDQLHHRIELAYSGTDGQSIASDEGFAIERWTYDADDDLVAVSFFDATGAPTIVHHDYASRKLTNDERGLVIAEEYLDDHGERLLKGDGYGLVRYDRDRNGDVVAEAYFGRHDERILSTDCACARTRFAYDIHRRRVETALFDADGHAAVNLEGWSIERVTYDDRGLAVRTDHLDGVEAPVLAKDGAASVVKTYDVRGNLIEQTTLGTEGRPVTAVVGYATAKFAYDDRDQQIEEAHFGPDGTPAGGAEGWSVERYRFDDAGNRLEQAYLDTDHHLVVPKEATYASVRNKYDARQRLVEAAYFDASGAPVNGPDGVGVVRYERDAYGHATEIHYLDASGVPAASIDGKLVVRLAYDDAGHTIDERSVDAAGAPRPANDGCAEHRTKYDPQGRVVEEDCLGPGGAPVLSTAGWATRRTQHDIRGNAVDVATYGVDGALRVDSEGIARKRSTFDERGNVLETAIFDAHDKPTRDRTGLYGTSCSYDDAGRKTVEKGLDAKGRATGKALKPK